ncbi:Dabb family protein [soil metagenome]
MKPLILSICIAALTSLALSTVAAQAPATLGNVNHVVAFKFKSTATPAQIKEVELAFRALQTKVPQIVSLKWGTNSSPEKLNKGFTHGWVLTFKTDKDRDAYLVHPDHQAFGKLVGPLLDDVFVIDFTARE